MTPMNRSRTARCFGALIGAAALISALPAPALAERRDERRHHDDRGRRGHDHDHERGRGHAYGWGHAPRGHGGHFAYRAPRRAAPPCWGRGGQRHHTPAYYCGRCRSHFGSYQGLYGHVHQHHHVPTWRVPRVLAQVSFGWAFGL
jgi:hypothetical protein